MNIYYSKRKNNRDWMVRVKLNRCFRLLLKQFSHQQSHLFLAPRLKLNTSDEVFELICHLPFTRIQRNNIHLHNNQVQNNR